MLPAEDGDWEPEWDRALQQLNRRAARWAAQAVMPGRWFGPRMISSGISRFLRSIVWSLKAGIGKALLRWGSRWPFVVRTGEIKAPVQADILLAGAQLTDVVHQAGLSNRLSRNERLRDRTLWLRMEPHAQLESAERAALTDLPGEIATVSMDDIPKVYWRWWPLRAWVWTASADLLVERIAALRSSGRHTASLELKLAVLTVTRGNASLDWRRWKEWLDSLGCRIVIGNSILFDMAYFRAWTRARHRPFLQLIHGLPHDQPQMFSLSDGDIYMLAGPIFEQMAQRQAEMKKCRLRVAGRMHYPVASRQKRGDDTPADEPKVMILAAMSYELPIQESPAETERWLLDIALASSGVGRNILFRPHPRVRLGSIAEGMIARAAHAGAKVELDRSDSLANSAKRCDIVVVSIFDGACAQVLDWDVIAIGYIPHLRWMPAERVLRRFAVLAKTRDELDEALHRLTTDSAFREERLRIQREFLRECLAPEIEDSWAVVEEEIERALDGSSSAANARAV